jgi:hypothetical protein
VTRPSEAGGVMVRTGRLGVIVKAGVSNGTSDGNGSSCWLPVPVFRHTVVAQALRYRRCPATQPH